MTKYRYIRDHRYTYTEVFRDDTGILIEQANGDARYWVRKDAFKLNYEEVKEPRTIKRYMNVYEEDGQLRLIGTLWVDPSNAEKAGKIQDSMKYIKTIEVSYTEEI